MTTQAEAVGALNASEQCLTNALAVARSRYADIMSQIQPAETGRAAINDARTALQAATAATAAADLHQLITAGVRASADGLQQASNLLDASAAVALTAGALEEWKECRATIDRCDKLLVDLRKTGFGFITAVVGAAAYVFTKPDHAGSVLKSELLCSLVVLILVLYLIDLAHQSWLVLAVERAKILEKRLNFGLTQMISEQFAASRATFLGTALYLLLLTASCVIFWASIPLTVEGPYSSPRANIYGAFAVGVYVIITSPWFSEWLSVGWAQLSKRAWRGLCWVTGLFLLLGVLLDVCGPFQGFFHHINKTYPLSWLPF
jgi:hypothetical protein